MAFRRSVEVPAYNFTTHELSSYGDSRDLGNGHEFHDCINFTFRDQPFDRLYLCHPLRPCDVEALNTGQLRQVLKATRKNQIARNGSAFSGEMEAREKSINVLRKALRKKAMGSCVVL